MAPALTQPPVLGERHVFLPPAAPPQRRASAARSEEAVESARTPHLNEERVSGRTGKGSVNKDSGMDYGRLPSATGPSAAGQPPAAASSSRGAGAVVVGVDSAAALPPGQAKKLEALPAFSALREPAAVLSGPPGQLEKLDTGITPDPFVHPGNGVGPPGGIPPGQAKR
jgi:hypothetical protein